MESAHLRFARDGSRGVGRNSVSLPPLRSGGDAALRLRGFLDDLHRPAREAGGDLLLRSPLPGPIRRAALALDSIDTPVGMPIAVVLSEDGTRLYVANAASDDISVIDLALGMSVGHVPVGHHPRDLALSPDGDRLYTINMVSDNVSVIETATMSVVDTLALTEDPRPSIIQQGERIFRTSRPDEIARDN
mgnify:CR=1 FL=1